MCLTILIYYALNGSKQTNQKVLHKVDLKKIVKNVSHSSFKNHAKNFNLISEISKFMTSEPGKNNYNKDID